MEKNDRDYSNGEITVHWQPSKCVHSTICYTKLRSVFDPSRRPWIRMDKGNTDEIIDIVNQCPTDALTFTRDKELEKNDEKKVEAETVQEDNSTNIQIMKDGPALVSGNFTITDINGVKLTKADNVALCRCGKSSTLPFCDGTHHKVGFKENR
jgi:uncharacterized Fe-S cluster protein YjdI